MSKPPESTPHSDIDGVRKDQRDVIEAATEAGQDAGDLARAREESAGRPDRAGEGMR